MAGVANEFRFYNWVVFFMGFVRTILSVSIVIYAFVLLLMFVLMTFQMGGDGASLQSPFFYLPFWLLFIPLIAVLPVAFMCSKALGWGVLVIAVLNGVQFSGFYVWKFPSLSFEKLPGHLRVLTLNQGGGRNFLQFLRYLEEAHVDLVLFQEAHLKKMDRMKKAGWELGCRGRLCVASVYPLQFITSFERQRRKTSGFAGVAYSVDVPAAGNEGKVSLSVYNVHLDTPRKALESMLDLDENVQQKVLSNFQDRRLESESISEAALTEQFALVAGDFNLLVQDPLYKKYWQTFNNAYSQVGAGFGFTKYTRWHGVRIDHLLASPTVVAHRAWIGPDFGGDHRPVVADFIFPPLMD